MKLSLAAALMVAAASGVSAAPVNLVGLSDISANQNLRFPTPDYPAGTLTAANPWANPIAGEVVAPGLRIGKRFAGQTVETTTVTQTVSYGSLGSGTGETESESLSGAPTGPLSLVTDAQNANLGLIDTNNPAAFTGVANHLPELGNLLLSNSASGYNNEKSDGSGSLALLFSEDQSELSFAVAGGEGGNMSFSFFRRDGSLISTVADDAGHNYATTYYKHFAFKREGGLSDIAGVSITTDDYWGVAYGDFSYTATTAPVPLPAAAWMLGAGLVALGAAGRRKRG